MADSTSKTSKTRKAAPAPEISPASSERVGKGHLSQKIADATGLPVGQSARAFDAVIKGIAEALKNGQSVNLPGIGSLRVKPVAARSGVRPGTTERIEIPAKRKVAFKTANRLNKEI